MKKYIQENIYIRHMKNIQYNVDKESDKRIEKVSGPLINLHTKMGQEKFDKFKKKEEMKEELEQTKASSSKSVANKKNK